jgi:Holliday junction resolvasome RuvABC endonuclease subunit
MKKVLALDPSFRNTGYAIIGVGSSKLKDKICATGVIKTEARNKKSSVRAADQNLEQIQIMANALRDLIKIHKPDILVAELPTSGGKSAKAVASMAIAQAVCGTVVAYEALPYEWVTPIANKKHLTGKRTASKTEMENAVLKIYPKLRDEYTHKKGQFKGKIIGEFEHIADAIGAYEACEGTSPLIRMLRKGD